jgi:chromosome segregation and condensation protein ScpB
MSAKGDIETALAAPLAERYCRTPSGVITGRAGRRWHFPNGPRPRSQLRAYREGMHGRRSRAATETLAIIASTSRFSRAEIEAIPRRPDQ